MPLCLLLAAGGCQQQSAKLQSQTDIADVLAAKMVNLAEPEENRLAADATLAAIPNAHTTRLSALERILTESGHSDDMRIYAADHLAQADPPRAVILFSRVLPRTESDAVIAEICRLAATLRDVRLIDPLIRNYQKTHTLDTAASPQAAAIESLTGKSFADSLADRIIDSQDTAARVAAISILTDLRGNDKVCQLLTEPRQKEDAFLSDLRWYVTLFNTAPIGAQEVAWARQLRKPQWAAGIARAHQAHMTLRAQADYVYAPRFAGILSDADSSALSLSRRDLEQHITARLSQLRHIRREPSYAHAPDDRDESFAANLPRLSRCDLLIIRQLLAIFSDPDFCRRMHQLGLEDLADTATERGGMISMAGNITIYPPMFPDNDQAYIAGDKLMAAIPGGLSPFHFHYHKLHNADFAGPGIGDLQFVRTNSTHSVVVTSLGEHEFDVDYFTPAGAVVDLGAYQAK